MKGGTIDVDRVLMSAISGIVNEESLDHVIEGLEGVREELPEGARFYFDMVLGLQDH